VQASCERFVVVNVGKVLGTSSGLAQAARTPVNELKSKVAERPQDWHMWS